MRRLTLGDGGFQLPGSSTSKGMHERPVDCHMILKLATSSNSHPPRTPNDTSACNLLACPRLTAVRVRHIALQSSDRIAQKRQEPRRCFNASERMNMALMQPTLGQLKRMVQAGKHGRCTTLAWDSMFTENLIVRLSSGRGHVLSLALYKASEHSAAMCQNFNNYLPLSTINHSCIIPKH